MESKEEKLAFKTRIKEVCVSVINERISFLIEAIQQAQDSANSESKSSMGDKYETTRAMGQLDADMNAKQLKEAQNELNALKLIHTDVLYTNVMPGSVVMFENTIFFIACGLGAIKFDNTEVITLSVKSPLYLQIKQKAIGDKFLFKNSEKQIEALF